MRPARCRACGAGDAGAIGTTTWYIEHGRSAATDRGRRRWSAAGSRRHAGPEPEYDAGDPPLRCLASAAALIAPVTDALKAHGAAIRDLSVTQATLEDVSIGLTGQGLR